MNKVLNSCFQYTLFLLFAFPLFKISIGNFLIILLLLFGLVHCFSQKHFPVNLSFLKLTIPFWIVACCSLFYINDVSWYKDIPNALPFLIYPLAFALVPNRFFSNDKMEKYLTVSKITCCLIIVTYISLFIWSYSLDAFFKIDYRISKFRDYIYNEIPVFRIHPTYFTLLLVFLSASSLENIFIKNKKNELLFLFFFTFITFLLLAKISIVLLGLLFAYYLLIKSKFSRPKKIAFVLVLCGIFIVCLWKIPGVYDRFYEIYVSFNTPPNGVAHDSTNIRLAVYKCDLSIIKDHYWNGLGFHNLKNEIYLCLSNTYVSDFYRNDLYLTHNYFFYILAGSGIFGLIFFLYYIYHIGRMVFSVKIFELSVFFISVIIVCFSEDFFYRSFGTILFHLICFSYFKNKFLLKEEDKLLKLNR